MKRRIALAFGFLSALSWVGAAAADEPIKSAPAPTTAPAPVIIKDGGEGAHHGYGHGADMGGDACCDHGGGGGGLNAGIGFYYIQPHFESNPAIFSYLNGRNVGDLTFTRARQDDFNYDWDFSWRFWVGTSNCDGAGARLRFWRFEDDASSVGVDNIADLQLFSAAPLGVTIATSGGSGDPETLSANTDLKFEVWDLEGTYTHKVCSFDMTYFGGLRYVHLSQSYTASVRDTNSATLVSALSSGHNFNVWGITGGVESRRALGGMGLSLYGSSRASLLYGTAKQTAASLSQVNQFGEGGDSSRDDLLPILEAELGAEWSSNVGGMDAFLQVALVGQVWFGAGNASRATSPDSLGVLRGGVEDDTNLGFFGITVSGGIRY